jgi:hypothetical protein
MASSSVPGEAVVPVAAPVCILCDLCDEVHAAVYRCQDCPAQSQHMCEVVKTAHEKGKTTKGHTLVELPGARIVPPVCPCGENEQVKLFDTKCKRLICLVCKDIAHKGHDVVMVKQEAATALLQVADLMGRTRAFETAADQAVMAAATALQVLQGSQRTQAQAIETYRTKVGKRCSAYEFCLLPLLSAHARTVH